MPKYRFTCKNCGNTEQLYISANKLETNCKKCQATMSREMPKLSGPAEVREVVNSHTNTKWKKDQKETTHRRVRRFGNN